LLNLPGSLSRVGLLSFVFSLYLIARRTRLAWALPVFVASAGLVLLDGSRTSTALALLGIVYVVVALMLEDGWRSSLSVGLAGLCLALLGLGAAYLMDEDILLSALVRLSSLGDEGVSLAAIDPDRYYMNQVSWQQIGASWFVGSGLHSILVPVNGVLTTIHNTYLQLWAEVGLVALLGFVVVAFAWLPSLPTTLRVVLHIRSIPDRAIAHNALFFAFCFPIASMFHPVSTEWSEWLPLLVAYTVLHRIQIHAANEPRGSALERDHRYAPPRAIA
jgi:hypothetical protein